MENGITGLVSGDELEATYKKKSQLYNYKNINKDNVEQYYRDGWEKVSINKSTGNVRIKKKRILVLLLKIASGAFLKN